MRSSLDDLQHVMGNDLLVISYRWRECMSKAKGIPGQELLKDLLVRATRIKEAIEQYTQED